MRAPDPTTVPEADGRRVPRLGQTSVPSPSGPDGDSADVLEPKRRIRLVELSPAIGRYGEEMGRTTVSEGAQHDQER